MDLIDKIKEILRNGSGLKAPVMDIHFDNQDNVIGYVADENFNNKDEKEAQAILYDALKKKLGTEELVKIMSIFPETFQERSDRLGGSQPKTTWRSKFWRHETREGKRYWLFLDVKKFGEDFKSFYLIVNQKDNFKSGLTLVYSKEILEFMELDSDEADDELYTNTFDYADNEIKTHLIEKYDKLAATGLLGKSNYFSYVFENFKLTPVSKKELIIELQSPEIDIIEKAIIDLDNFNVKNDITEIIKKSRKFNEDKKQIA